VVKNNINDIRNRTTHIKKILNSLKTR